MLRNLKELYGNQLAASDGDIGHVKDFYFDDQSWAVRYLVADTGSWLKERLVLLSPHAFGRFDRKRKRLTINLTRARIENSPSIEAHQSVSRQYEIDYYRYYGWPVYWAGGGAMSALGGYPAILPAPKGEVNAHHRREDKHLQSVRAVTGYPIQAVDGAIGRLSGLMANSRSWAIRALVVETGHWYSENEILIAPSKVERISYEESKVFVSLTMADIRRTAEGDQAKAGVRNLRAQARK